jgi:transcription antitermination factor NusG
MIKNILAVLVLSLTVAACDSGSTDTPSNTNNPAKTSTPVQSASTPAATASSETSPSATLQIKAGDKVKAANGSFSDATVVSLDEKAGKVTIKVAGESKERIVALSEIVKQ